MPNPDITEAEFDTTFDRYWLPVFRFALVDQRLGVGRGPDSGRVPEAVDQARRVGLEQATAPLVADHHAQPGDRPIPSTPNLPADRPIRRRRRILGLGCPR